jgi:anti-sigma factor RsiW
MDRYQFEDLISDYLENQLPLPKRKAFEQYQATHPEARELVESVRRVMVSLRQLPPAKTSPDFMAKLQRRIDRERTRPVYQHRSRRTILGFTPLYAGLSVTFLIALIYIGLELLPGGNPEVSNPRPQYTEGTSNPVLPSLPATAAQEQVLAETEEDSLAPTEELPAQNIDLRDRIQFVKNPQ